MEKGGIKRILPRVMILLAGGLLFLSVFFLMNYVQFLLNADVEINLTEIATQNKDVITTKLQLEVNNVDAASTQVSENLKRLGGEEHLVKAYQDYIEATQNELLYIAKPDGTAIFSDGATIDVSGRSYFRNAIHGNQNISDKVVSRLNGEEVFIISVPIEYENKVIGTLQKFYSSNDMYELCKLSLFSSKGYMNILNGEGDLLVSSENESYNNESDNYYRILSAQGNEKASQLLKEGIEQMETGFIETRKDGERIFSVYTPIEGVHDWYLVSSISTAAVSPNANIVIKMFYFILCLIVIIFAICLLYFLSYKNRQQAKLSKIAFVDSVTQGNTYNKFTVLLEEALLKKGSQKYYLMVMDIDNFKYINSYYGFDVGDKILYQIYHSIASLLKKEEELCRISSDHFVILLNDANQQRLNAIVKVASQNEQGLRLYFTAGVYEIKDASESTSLMLDKASAAAHASKDTLHKRIQFYTGEYDAQMIHNEQMKRNIEKGLANSEMIPYFQPKINIHDRSLVGAEALARWKKADGTLVPPFEFIPLCEKTGLIVDLDMMIFEKTLQFIRHNLDQNISCVPISVNFSRIHLMDETFLNQLEILMKTYDIPNDLIELELTESIWIDNHELIKGFIEKVHEQGWHISMDDFGSGYSSLNMLKDVKIDVLKIDQAFLQTTEDGDRQKIILAAIVKMAKELNIKIVVEGVETTEQVTLMEEVGCNIAQGYHYARPMDEESFEKVFRKGKV